MRVSHLFQNYTKERNHLKLIVYIYELLLRAEFSAIMSSSLNQNNLAINFLKKCQVAIMKNFVVKFLPKTLGQV